jgi:hypothetical protein
MIYALTCLQLQDGDAECRIQKKYHSARGSPISMILKLLGIWETSQNFSQASSVNSLTLKLADGVENLASKVLGACRHLEKPLFDWY